MAAKTDNPLARFERQRTNYPLIAAVVALFVVTISGVVISGRAEDWTAAALFFAATLVFAVVLLLHTASTRRRAATDDRKLITWAATEPDIQRQNVNLEVRELARLLNVGGDSLTDLLSAYIVAEDLALREIQQQERLPLMRHVRLGNAPFDAVLIEQDTITCIEVSFLVAPDVRHDKFEAMFKKMSTAKKNLHDAKSRLRLKLMLVLVMQLSDEDEEVLRLRLKNRQVSETPLSVDIRLLDFEELQQTYVTD